MSSHQVIENPLLNAILERNRKEIEAAGEVAEVYHQIARESEVPPSVCFWASLLSAVSIAHVGTRSEGLDDARGKAAFMNGAETIWEAYRQYVLETEAGVGDPQGTA